MKAPSRKNFDMGMPPRTPIDNWSFSVMPDVPEIPKNKFQAPKIGKISLPEIKYTKKDLIPFVAGALVVVLLSQLVVYGLSAKHAQKQILGAATNAYSDLSSAGGSLRDQNFSDAKSKFTDALSNLKSAEDELSQFRALGLISPQVGSASHILDGATALAQAGTLLSDGLAIFGQVKISDQGLQGDNLQNLISQNRDSMNRVQVLLNKSKAEFNSVGNVPSEYQDTLNNAKIQINALTGMVGQLVDLEDIYLGFFGSGPRVYLLVFQNPDEVRATGGFMGTYGVLTADNGKIQDLNIRSIYDLDGHIYQNVAAPGPFQPYIQKWGIRDTNWFADFPTSARKMLQFFEYGSQTADGVIVFSPKLFEDLLTLTGPIPMPDYNLTLSTDNFQQVVQYKTSIDYNRKLNEPKQMLADFAPVLLNKLSTLNQDQWLQLLQIMEDNLSQKNILLYSKDANLQQKIVDLKVAGNILNTTGDYLNIVNTNLGGTKSDLKVAQAASLDSKILSDGSIVDTLTINRKNNSGEKNVDYMRVLVPTGSILISSKGFDQGVFNPSTAQNFTTDPDLADWDQGQIYNNRTFVRTESGKSEFAGWLSLDPGENKTVTLVYQIGPHISPDMISQTTFYSLLFQKQDGVPPYSFSASLSAGAFKANWLSADASQNNGKINFSYNTKSDQYWAVSLNR